MANPRSIIPLSVLATVGACCLAILAAIPVQAQSAGGAATAIPQGPIPATAPTYVDLVELGLASDMVLRSEVRRQTNVPADRAPGLEPGKARLYVRATTQALLAGSGPVGSEQAFLVDLPLNARGRRPDIKKEVVLLFAARVPNRPGEIQLVGRQAIQPYDPALEQRVRQVLTQLVQPDRPPLISGVREVMSVPGNLAGESETQVFLETPDGAPVSLTVLRRPGMQPGWGVSWTDIVDQSARPPAPETLQWYALACFLPTELPESAFIQTDPASRARAREDYALVVRELGACARSTL
ncbi:hypothetical protein M3P36_02105 [Altererythrobacter sp. KTW20L]|uniref:hypothetical protein n=1 Tax=Altererythrobacter sp. KTW20L TaxID=2942210 RepID=UPI0020BD5860|nr:hypothetical protein [Altererythrobacter sp. KTW20L]MCL6249843.1 hypothetical protein [Altererythrobacter sp. KTW20L]